jgi:small GTP-binding protein
MPTKEDRSQDADQRLLKAKQSKATSLDLSGLNLTVIPEAVFQLTDLQQLYLNNNQITAVPDAVSQLANLQELNLGSNQIKAIPETLSQLANLQTLSLGNNQITDIPEAIGRLANLQRLNLGSNQIITIPEAMGQLTNLQSLYVYGNQVTAIPEKVGQLVKLHTLYLGNNQISVIPEWMSQLANLEDLSLHDNQITTVPEAVGQLAHLQELDLSNNQLTEIPEALGRMPKLTGLYLHGNLGLGVPEEILGPRLDEVIFGDGQPKPPREILNYVKSLADAKPLNEAKLIMVGQGAVGKTSLVKKLTTGKFNHGEKTTEGIKISDWSCSITGNSNVKVHIWDFGGQEMMHATHQFFLTARSLYLLVLNRRTGGCDREADYWLRLIRAFGGKDAPVVVVLNKHKSEPFDVNRGG